MTTAQRPLGSGFGPRSTASDVLAGRDLTGQHAIVTGGYSGLGLEITRALTAAGAEVVVPARRPRVAHDALGGIAGATVAELDLADLGSVAEFAATVVDAGRPVDLLLNNAGVMACPETRVGPGWEAQFATNHLGHFALTNRLAPALKDRGARVVAVSSTGHFRSGIRWDDIHFESGYDRWLAYGQSKTANALFALHLDALGAASGVRAFSAHPGGIVTPLQRHVSFDDQVALGWLSADGEPNPIFKTPEQGASTAVWAATSPLLAGEGGVYLHDCDVAVPAPSDDPRDGGVKPWATDPAEASRLWDYSVEATGVDGFGA